MSCHSVYLFGNHHSKFISSLRGWILLIGVVRIVIAMMFCILICDIPTCHAGLPSLLLDGKSHPTSPSLGLPPSFPVPVVLAALRPFHSFHCALYVPRVQSLPVFCSVCSASEPIFVPKDSCHLLLVILSSFMMAFSLRVAFMYWYCVFTVPSVGCLRGGDCPRKCLNIFSHISLANEPTRSLQVYLFYAIGS